MSDILDENGNCFHFTQLKGNSDTKCNFLNMMQTHKKYSLFLLRQIL